MKTNSRKRSRRNRFRPRLQALEARRLLVAAVDLASITGRVFDDVAPQGFNAGEQVVGASVQLFTDNGDGTFGTGDTQVGSTAVTDANGFYRFDRLTARNYFVVQPFQTVGGSTLQRTVSPLIQISSTDAAGQIATLIDSFNLTNQSATDSSNDSTPVTSTIATAPGEAFGGERDLFVNKTSVDGNVQLLVDDPSLTDRLAFGANPSGNGQWRISWDGADGDATTIADDLLSQDFTAGDALGLGLEIGRDANPGTAIVRLYSNDGNAATANAVSTHTFTIPDTSGGPLVREFIPFTSFTGSANVNAISAVEVEINGATDLNGVADFVGTLTQTETTQDFDNFEVSDLGLSKSVSDTMPTTGQNVTFVITLNNNGPDAASGVQITDQLPAGVAYVSHNAPTGTTYTPGTGIWNVGDIASGTSTALSIVANVQATTANVITNTASVTASSSNDLVVGNNQASASLTPETVDIGLTKMVDNMAPNIGDQVTFTIVASNTGPSTATNIVITDPLPAGLNLVSASPSLGNFNPATGVWTIDSLNAVGSANLSIVATVNSNAAQINTATLTSVDQTDTNASNNQATATLTARTANLSLTKTVNNSIANVGDDVTFTVTVNNAGPNDATGVQVTDQLPAGLSLTSFTTSPGTTFNSATGVWTVGNVPFGGASPTLSLVARVDSIGAKTNTAQISAADQTDPNSIPGNNLPAEDDQDSAVVTPASADLSLDKQADNLSPTVGDNVTFTINVSNLGPNSATDVVVRDVLPSGMAYVSDNAGTAFNPATGLWNVGTITAGSSRSLQLVAEVTSASSALINTARVESVNEFDPDSSPGNDVLAEDDQDSVTLTPQVADLSLTKTVSDASPSVNEQVTFTINVRNSGPDAATGVQVVDQLPAGITVVSTTPSQGNFTAGTWDVGSIANGGIATLSIVGTANTTGIATNTAQITQSDQSDPDSTPNNNDAAEDDQASAQISAEQIDLSVTKTVNNSSPNVGEQVVFTVTVANGGPSDATGVQISESLPTGTTLISSNPSQGSFNLGNGVWTVGTIPAGQQASIQLTATVTNSGTGINTAQVSAADQNDIDSMPGNNDAGEDDQASISFTTPVADLSLNKTVSNASPNVGDMIRFDIELTNSGPDDATGVEVTDLLPSGLLYISNNLSAGTYDPSTGIWNVGGLANGATATLELIASVQTQNAGTNTARVTAVDQTDPDSTPGNDIESEDDQSSISFSPATVDVSLTKTASPMRPAVGSDVTFTVTASNAGPDAATGVVVTDVLPAGLTFVSASPTAAYNSATGVWTVGSLASGDSSMLQLVARVENTGDKTNTAEVTALEQFDINSQPGNGVASENDQASVTITPASADLSITKSVDDASPNVGQTITYTVTVNNAGPDVAENVMVRDTLPSGVTQQSAIASSGAYSEATRVWTIPSLSVGASASLQITALVDTPGDKTNSAEIIASSQFDPDSTPDNNIASEDDQASALLSPELVDLALTKSINDSAPNIGDTITYTLMLANSGPTTATGVMVTDLLPSNLTFSGSTQTTGTYNASTGVWDVGQVAVGDTPTLTINAVVGSTRGETNTAEITAVDQPDVDSTPANGVVGEDDIASTTFTTQIADLSLTKTVDNAMPNQTDNVNFTISLSNEGPNNATDVVVTDLLPSGLRVVSSTPSVGSYNPENGEWSVASVGVGATATLQIVAAITSAVGSENVAEITSARQFDPDSTPGNGVVAEDDHGSAAVMPQVVDISVASSVDNPEPLEGETVQIVFTATNDGPADATNVTLNTLLPLGLTLISSQPQVGSYDSVTGTWNVGSLASGASTRLTLNARVDTRGVKNVPIEVTSTDQFDIDSTPANNVPDEDDQVVQLIRAPRLLNKRLFMAR